LQLNDDIPTLHEYANICLSFAKRSAQSISAKLKDIVAENSQSPLEGIKRAGGAMAMIAPFRVSRFY
jgi:hypothetical protein